VPEPRPPLPLRRPTVLTLHGDERVDDWYWMRDRDDPAVLAHLEAENAYTAAVLGAGAELEERIYAEIRSHVAETDESAPVPDGPWEYYTRTVEGLQYPLHCRRPRGGGAEQVLLDENVEARGKPYFSLGVYDVSPDHRLLAFAVDTTGDERHDLRFRDLTSGRNLDEVVPDVAYGFAWVDDGHSCFYVVVDDALRPWQVRRHVVGTPVGGDAVVYEDRDEHYEVDVERARSGRVVLVSSQSKTTAEVWWAPTDDPTGRLRPVVVREAGQDYRAEHYRDPDGDDWFVLVTNAGGARNFKVVMQPAHASGRDGWREVLAHRDDVRFEAVDAFAGHLVVTERRDGLQRVRVLRAAEGPGRPVDFAERAFTSWVGPNAEYETPTVRLGFTSLVAPSSDVDLDLDSFETRVRKTQPVPGYDPSRYVSDRIWATAPDGTQVPVSIVHRHDVALDGTAPGMIYGYGAYEFSVDPAFRASRLSLIDRGFVFAIAHVRGGGELGRVWYEQGRLANKPNTFGDFIACAQHLLDRRYVATGRLVARGGSAGGMLMGVVANERPDLFGAIIAEVPFVDVLTTMLDASLPLTVTEWEEWGDPRDRVVYEAIKRYSPYDNVAAKPYPAMFVTTGLNDPRVQYWEPVKWVAKLRAATTSGQPILLRTDLGAGHGGPSGRYDAWRQEAQVLAFACRAVGVRD